MNYRKIGVATVAVIGNYLLLRVLASLWDLESAGTSLGRDLVFSGIAIAIAVGAYLLRRSFARSLIATHDQEDIAGITCLLWSLAAVTNLIFTGSRLVPGGG